jgi:hypothetical protein
MSEQQSQQETTQSDECIEPPKQSVECSEATNQSDERIEEISQSVERNEEPKRSVERASIEENNERVPQMYIRHNRCFVKFPFNQKIVDTVKLMANRWWTPKTREWSFDISCREEFLSVHPNTIELKYDMIIYKTRHVVYFKFIDTHNLEELSQVIGEVTYDLDGHVFMIAKNQYGKMVEYVKAKGLHALLRNYEQTCSY